MKKKGSFIEGRAAGSSVGAWRIPKSRRFDNVPMAAFRSFIAVVEAGGFSPAARELRVAVSTVSKHIDVLEARLQTTLLQRSTRRVMLSDAGLAFYNQCKLVVDRLDEIVEANIRPAALHGLLRVASPSSFTNCVLSPALPKFLTQHPALRVELRVTTASIDFLRDGIDLAVRTTKDHGGNGPIEYIGPAPSVLCAAPEYLAQYGDPAHPQDLRNHRCLGGINSPYGDTWQFKIDGVIENHTVPCMFATDTGDVLRQACLQGLGIAGFYRFHIEDDMQAGHLIPVLVDYQADVSAVYVARPASRYPSPNAEAFVAFIREVCTSTASTADAQC